jgi:Arc/MetJ-type ribon-helix-helix transcriptional regulator
MHVELSREAQERVESLVASGAYPSVEAAVEAAVDALEPPGPGYSHEEISALSEVGRKDIAAGRFRVADDAFIAELRGRVGNMSPRR